MKQITFFGMGFASDLRKSLENEFKQFRTVGNSFFWKVLLGISFYFLLGIPGFVPWVLLSRLV